MNDADDAQQKGAVYCVTNSTMPDLVKIGLVENGNAATLPERLKKRMNHLYNTSVPVLFDLHYAAATDNPQLTERRLHDAFQPARVNPNREFFRLDPEQVVAAMQLTGGERVTISAEPSDDADDGITQADINAHDQSQARETKRLSNFKFSMVDISPKAELSFSRDRSITATVHGDKTIIFDDEEMSLSVAANKILSSDSNIVRVAGPHYWKYDGEMPNERRKRMEKEKAEAESDLNE
ncbi:GIY-YIG nuclease family protein [Candidatus Spongiihabitans sp.]|uniref:GIY-YIG nuclease family protein n=1 Tax=Candidatus Spongiihabitans sp. TaxID=3101308 RepID=UPI003C79A9D5